MLIPEQCRHYLEQADGKALATFGPAGLNVVPVSTARVAEDTIVLVDYFMGKTVTNLKANPTASLAVWVGFTGCQIKATAEYLTEGEQFDEIVSWDKEKHPDRTIKGVIILTPTEIFSVTAGPAAGARIV